MAGFKDAAAARGWRLARAVVLGAAAAGLLVAASDRAEARVRFGLGFSFPLYGGGYPRYYAPPPPPVYYAPPPPPVYYAPPPAYYAPPPQAYYPPPAYASPAYAPPAYAGLPGGLPPSAVPISPAWYGPGGQTCRQYSATIYVYGRPQTSYGTACLQPDGTWRMVN